MFQLLRQYISPMRRVQILQALPKVLRHLIVDFHLGRTQRKYRSFLQQGGVIGIENKAPIQVWESGINEHATNTATYYATSPRRFDVDRLFHYFAKFAIKGKIMDFGCNAGRALHHFTDAGYSAIGVEINGKAVEHGKTVHASLNKAKFHIGDGETVLPTLENRSAELGYSIAVLRHISPATIDGVVAQLCRIVSGYFITIEDEASISPLSFPHDYKNLFGRHGWRQIAAEYAVDWPGFEGSSGTMLRIFSPVRPFTLYKESKGLYGWLRFNEFPQS